MQAVAVGRFSNGPNALASISPVISTHFNPALVGLTTGRKHSGGCRGLSGQLDLHCIPVEVDAPQRLIIIIITLNRFV